MIERPCACDKPACPFCHHWKNTPAFRKEAVASSPRFNAATFRSAHCVALGAKAIPDCACTDRHCLLGLGVVRHTEHCQKCDKYATQKSASNPVHLSHQPDAIKAYQAEADAFIANMPTYPGFSGRGVVIAGGGKYWASAYITVRMLRHVGCKLPVELWYLGASGERDERYEKLLAPLDVAFRDIDTHPARASRRGVAGFQTKLFAAVNSQFAEVLSLDPDNYPCQDPTMLFDCPSYKRLGGIYWPDRDFTDGWTKWAIWGCARHGPCGLETGQYVLHKHIAWEPMLLAEWYDDRPEMYYGTPTSNHDVSTGADYGDKGPHRAAWAKLKRDYAVFNPVAKHRGFAYLQPGPDGHTPMFVHRCHSKFTLHPTTYATTNQVGENLRGGYPLEAEALGYLEELRGLLC